MHDPISDAREACKAAIEAAGGAAAIGRALNLSRYAAHQWDVVPARHMPAVSRITGMPLEKLRPDLFANPREVA